MRCQRVRPYLAGHAGGDLQPETASLVDSHLRACAGCRAEAERFARVRAAVASLGERELEPPAYLAEAILESTSGAAPSRVRRLLPIPPVPPQELARVIGENRDAIASAAGAALLAAGAAYALWRAVRSARPRPATS